MHWRLLHLLKTVSELFLTEEEREKSSENYNQDNKGEEKNKIKQLFAAGGILPKGINLNPNVIKGIVLAVTGTVIYFLFFHNTVSYIVIKKVESAEDKVTITSNKDATYEISKTDYEHYTNVRKQANNGNQSVFSVFTKSKQGKISFNITQTLGAQGKVFFKLDNGCTFCNGGCSLSSGSSSSATTCNGCCDGTKGNSDCCTSTATTGDKCCLFSQILSYAVNHPDNSTPITLTSIFFSIWPTILSIFVFIFLTRFIMKQQMGMGGKDSIFQIGKSISNAVKTNIKFDDVAGLKEEKFELQEIVDYLINPSKYKSMGVRVPKGVMLYGPPGTGKTLLAKAVSGEANVPFLEASGASFDDMFVGLGAKRVRELFQKAKKLAPCIIFIDEIDALAAKRSQKQTVGGGSGDQTINQFLSELDGFNTISGIVVIAATNRLETIDEAVLRPGRFDRHIMINLPDVLEREEILRVHSNNKNVSALVDLRDVARKTPGFSGAQLENVMNEAALMAVRNNKRVIGLDEISEGIDRVMAGPAKKTRKISDVERRQIAHHEAGHAIAGLYVSGGEVVEKITIIPRGRAGGYMLTAPEKEEIFIKTKDQLISSLICLLAGRAAEEIFYGTDKIGSGASNDLYRATHIARDMVTKLGMSEAVGLVQHTSSEYDENPYKNSYSESTGIIIDNEIKKLIQEQYEKAKELISQNKEEMLLIVETLLLMETIDRKDIYYIHENKKMPEKALKIQEQNMHKDSEEESWNSIYDDVFSKVRDIKTENDDLKNKKSENKKENNSSDENE